jgi:site-specific recombinase XerD
MQLHQASSEFLNGYFSTHERRKKTKDAYRSDLAQFRAFASEELILSALDGSIIERWAAHLRQEDYSPASIRRKMVVLKVFCSYWVRRGDLKESPFWRVKLSIGRVEQLPRALTEREMRALLKRAWRDYSSMPDIRSNPEDTLQSTLKWKASSCHYRVLRDLALIDLLFATGIRVGEASALDIRDFFVREAAFRVQGKGGRDRLAFIVDEETVRIQRAHLVRHSLSYVSHKDRKAVADGLKEIYQAATMEEAERQLAQFEEAWASTYPVIARSWRSNWARVVPMFSYPSEIRRAVYTTNTIESLNMTLRKVSKNRSLFPNDEAVFKLMYLALKNISKRWTMPIKNWSGAMNQFAILFDGRVPMGGLNHNSLTQTA